MGHATHILIADHDAEIGRMLAMYMPGFGYEVSLATTAAQLDVCLRARQPDLIVLDPSLLASDMGKAEQSLRSRTQAPFILLCGASMAFSHTDAIHSCADDVLFKPFEPRELVMRVQAVLHRAKARADEQAAAHTIAVGEWMLDTSERRLHSALGDNVELSLSEYRLLMTFLPQPTRAPGSEQPKPARVMAGDAHSIESLLARQLQR